MARSPAEVGAFVAARRRSLREGPVAASPSRSSHLPAAAGPTEADPRAEVVGEVRAARKAVPVAHLLPQVSRRGRRVVRVP